MKNFFKKLSFVMALAMVLTALAPAVAGADASYIYKKGNDTQNEAVEVWFGDAEAKRDLNVKINGKKTTDGEWKIGNTKIATIDENGVVTPVKNGTTTAKFTAADGTVAKVKVVVGTRAAGVKVKDNGTVVTELTLTAGEAKELKFGAYISGKAKNAGATKASQEVAMTVEGEAVTTAVDGKYVTVTGAKAGEATLTFTAGKKTATVAVTVVEGLAAAQTGAAKITVTGSDLTDKVADYAVKRGTINVSIKSVALNEDKTEAVLTASVSNLTAGEYTLSFQKSEAVAFAVEAAVVANIEIQSDVAVLLAGSTTQAAATYKVFNQFGEDVTKTASMAGNGKITVSGGTTDYQGNVTFTAPQGSAYTPNLSVVALTIVCNTNGVNATKTLTVSNEAVLDTVEYVGVYANTAAGFAPAALQEGMTASDLSNAGYYMLFAGKDQYGAAYTNGEKLNVVVSGIPGVVTTGAATTKTVNNVTYIAYALTASYDLMAGSSNVLAIVTTNGKSAQGTVDVAPATKIASISISTAEVYGAKATNVLDYEIVDTNGELVTSYAVLKAFEIADLNDAENQYLPDGVTFGRNKDGSATMYYSAPSNDTLFDNVVVLTFRSQTNVFNSARLTVRPNCKATAITGVKATTILGAVSGQSITIKATDLVVLDQYGNTVTGLEAADFAVSVPEVYSDAFTGVATTDLNAGEVVVISTDAAKQGTMEVTFKLKDSQGNAIEDSASTVTVVATNIEKLANFAVADKDLLHHNTNGIGIVVTGTVGGVLVKLPNDCFTVVDNTSDGTTINTPEIDTTLFPETTKTLTFNVAIANQAGTIVSKTVSYSNTVDTVTTVALNPQAALTETTVDMSDLLGVLIIKDQYNETDISDANARAHVSGMVNPYATVDNNNTKNIVVNGLTVYDVILTVVYTFSNGTVFETVVPVSITY